MPLAPVTGTPTAQVSGTDPDGAHWTLKLYGPGTLNVVDANGNAFTKATTNTPDSINTITVGGSSTIETRLVGTVTPAPDGNSNVYFENLVVTPTGQLGKIDSGQVNNIKHAAARHRRHRHARFLHGPYRHHQAEHGLAAAHRRRNWPGYMNIPGGVINLRFGGVDADLHATRRDAAEPDRAEQRVRHRPRPAARHRHQRHRQQRHDHRPGQYDRGLAAPSRTW